MDVQSGDIVGTAEVASFEREIWIKNTIEAGEMLLQRLKDDEQAWKGHNHIHASFGRQCIGVMWNNFFERVIPRMEAVLEKWKGASPVDLAVEEIIKKLEPLGLSREQMMSVQSRVERHYD
jgi:hypothetical protein